MLMDAYYSELGPSLRHGIRGGAAAEVLNMSIEH